MSLFGEGSSTNALTDGEVKDVDAKARHLTLQHAADFIDWDEHYFCAIAACLTPALPAGTS